MAKQAGIRPGGVSTPAADAIPDKLYFRIGEVASLCGVETYVLRFWQTEFPQLKPVKSGTGQRLYRKRDVEMALRIKRLLHDDGYTIAGARQVFAAEALELRGAARQPELPLATERPAPEFQEIQESWEAADRVRDRAADRAQASLQRMRLELRELHSLLSQAPASPRAPRGKREREAASLFPDAASLLPDAVSLPRDAVASPKTTSKLDP